MEGMFMLPPLRRKRDCGRNGTAAEKGERGCHVPQVPSLGGALFLTDTGTCTTRGHVGETRQKTSHYNS